MLAVCLTCKKCGSVDLVKNGYNSSNNPKYKCKSCGFSGVISSKRKSETEKDLLIKACQERCSSRGLGRIFGVSHQTVLNWIKKKPSR